MNVKYTKIKLIKIIEKPKTFFFFFRFQRVFAPRRMKFVIILFLVVCFAYAPRTGRNNGFDGIQP